jgi:hypothetical protein
MEELEETTQTFITTTDETAKIHTRNLSNTGPPYNRYTSPLLLKQNTRLSRIFKRRSGIKNVKLLAYFSLEQKLRL